MADPASAQLAALLLSQQRRTTDPAEQSRRYGQRLLEMGSSVEPVRSPLEGLARALQGGVGGFFEGQAEARQGARDQETIAGLSDYARATDDAGRNAAMARLLKGDPLIVAPFLTQEIADKRALGIAQRGLAGMPMVGGGATTVPGAGGGAPAQPGQPLTIDMTPLPAGQIPQSGGFANNVGNIRATPGVSFPGQGAPQNGFMTFGTPQEGVNAARANLGAYVQQNPQITVAQAIAKWAPPNENNTQQYISQVAEGTGINPGMPLAEVLKDPAVSAQLLDAITRKEKGGLPPGVNADTFMTATGGAPAGPQVAQGSAQGPTPAPSAPVAPPATVPREMPQAPEISPQALELQRQAQELQKVGTLEAVKQAQALQAKALEAQAAWVQDRAKIENQRQFEISQDTRKRQLDQPQESFGNATKLRTEFEANPPVKAYRVVVPMLESAKDAATRPTRAADINLIYAFAKLMDPESVVRESETGIVTASASVADRLQGLIGQLNGGQMLQPETRQRLLAELQSRFGSLEQSYKEIEKSYRGIAERNQLNPEDVIVPIRRPEAGRPQTSGTDLKKKYGLE